MKYRKFIHTDISEIGLGTWQLGSADWGEIDKEKAFTILQKFVDMGGNFIDTADVYGMGKSERVIGEFVKASGKKIFIASKIGRRNDGENGWPYNFTYDFIRQHVEEALERMQMNSIFLEQFHCIPTAELKTGKVFDHINRLQDEGMISHWGVSVETIEEALLCLEQDNIASLQIIFNIFRQHVADELFLKAAKKGVALIIRVPLASGLLTGKFTSETRFSNRDHRNYNANGDYFNVGETFSGIEFSKGIEFVDKIKTILPKGNMSQWSIRWILDHPEVTTVIPGASKVDQVAQNMQASDLHSLDNSTRSKLKSLYDNDIIQHIRGDY